VIRIDFTLILTVINFAILYFVLRKILFIPVLEFISKREQRIVRNNEESIDMQNEAEKLENEYLLKVRKGKRESAKLIEQAKQEAWSKRKKDTFLVQEANQKKLVEVKLKLDEQSDKARELFKGKVSSVASSVSEKILGRAV